jgi:hypothetical protein
MRFSEKDKMENLPYQMEADFGRGEDDRGKGNGQSISK